MIKLNCQSIIRNTQNCKSYTFGINPLNYYHPGFCTMLGFTVISCVGIPHVNFGSSAVLTIVLKSAPVLIKAVFCGSLLVNPNFHLRKSSKRKPSKANSLNLSSLTAVVKVVPSIPVKTGKFLAVLN